MRGGSYARQHEYLRRADRARAQDDLVALDRENLAAAFNGHARRHAAVELHAVDDAVGADGQVQPVARNAEVAEIGTPAYAVRVVQREWSHAGGVGVVVVGAVFKPVIEAGLIERLGDGLPRLFGESVADDRPVRAVKVVRVGGVGFELAEVGQAVFEPPLAVSPRLPVVVILRDAAQEYLPVDGG